VPSGAVFGVQSFIGSECYINPKLFFAELEELAKVQPNIASLVKIARNAHVVSDAHIAEEANETKIGSTKRGVGPCARDKYSRVGVRAEDVAEFKPFVVDTYEEFYVKNPSANILFEGAQSYWLDISHGDYPFVTSSHCGIGAFLNNGFNHKQVEKVIGVVKAYNTYVGAKAFQDRSDPMLDMICEVGHEFGSTTGRRRQVGYIDLDKIAQAADINGADEIVVNKTDVLQKVGCWKAIQYGEVRDFETEEKFKYGVRSTLSDYGRREVRFSYSPFKI